MIDDLQSDLQQQMEKAISGLKGEFSRLRSGRATPTLLEGVRVDYYGTQTPISQMANVNAPEPRLLVVQPWDQNALPLIEKAIQKADLGLAPQNDGKVIRLPFPPLTEDRRKELVKVAHKFGEECRVSIRNARRHGMDELKKAEKSKDIGQDDQKRGQEKVQELTDNYIKKVDELVEVKSKEILEV